MRLSDFVRENLETILVHWVDFARSIQPPHRTMDEVELRDHAEELLHEIAAALAHPRPAMSWLDHAAPAGSASGEESDSAAERHAVQRLLSGFTIDQLVAEYCALRGYVLALWERRAKTATWFEPEDTARFNAALDRALSQSVARYSKLVRQAQDMFIGILGHDIRTPLNAISIGAETLMRADALDGKHIRIASRIFNSSVRISSLVDNLVDFTRARVGMQLVLRPANLALLAEQVIEEILSAQPERRIDLNTAGALDGNWDSGRICQVLSNLIGNALQHGSESETVTVALAEEGDHAILSVHNHGHPIPEDEIGHIFEPLRRYARSARHDNRPQVNLGLGLYIAREVVLAHGGSITVTSGAAQGTTFTVRLPLQAA